MEVGFRKGQREKLLKQIKNTLSDEEANRIAEVREFLNLEPDTYAWKIALHMDSIKQTIRRLKLDIDKVLWSINNSTNNILRCETQIKSGKITEVLKDNIIMNENELLSNIEYIKWTQAVEVNEIPKLLSQIRMLTGNQDLLGNIIMTNEQFEEYVREVIIKLEGLGFKLLE